MKRHLLETLPREQGIYIPVESTRATSSPYFKLTPFRVNQVMQTWIIVLVAFELIHVYESTFASLQSSPTGFPKSDMGVVK